MQVILKPVSHPELGEIVIRDSLFPIGRHEAPFSGYGAEVVAKLSRRHARIFEQDGAVYLVDLGSLNGTALNGAALDKRSVQVRQNDEICFGGYLTYRAELLGRGETGAAVRQEPPGVILTLLPEHPESGLEPLVISRFPFLISKADEAFARYRSRFPEEVRFLSRRHAHIFARDRQLLIEDLGSTNGTFLSGTRLDEQARVLANGDLLGFGGEHFQYRVHINVVGESAATPTPEDSVLTAALESPADVTRTTFVTSANSFLDIFCSGDEGDAPEPPADVAVPAATEEGEAAGRKPGGGQPAGKGRVAVFSRELRRAFFDDKSPGSRRALRWGAAVLLLVAGAGVFAYFQGAPRRTVGQLLDAGSYRESAARADAWLAHHSDDAEIADLGSTATLRALMPDWTAALDDDHFDQARAAVADARGHNGHNRSAQPMLDLLDWVTDLEQYIQERGGVDAPIVMFQHEERITKLLDWWDQDASARQQTAARIKRYDTGFEGVLARALSHLRALHSEKSLYLAAIDDFRKTLQQHLDQDDLSGLPEALADFSAKYPRIAGVDVLAQDIRNYTALDAALRAHDWMTAIEAVEGNRFFTPPFRAKVAEIRDRELPPKDIAVEYRDARKHWRDGDSEGAIRMLEALAGGAWGKIATADLEHMRTVMAGYQALAAQSGDEDHAQKLIAFHAALDPVEDVYFLQALNKDYETYRGALLKEAGLAFGKAGKAWETYDSNGRILGLLRLEANVSQKFRDQAAALTQAYDNVHGAWETYASLAVEPDQDQQALYGTILKECRLQRRSLQELGMVLDANLLRSKLALLPNPAPEAAAETAATAPSAGQN